MTLDVDVDAVPAEDLPALLGQIAELEARIRLRIARIAAGPPQPRPDRLLTAKEAAEILGTSVRWVRTATRGLALRRDLSRKESRFSEAGLRAWMERRRK